MTKEELAHDIEALCHRPQMYTPTGTFFEVARLIEGMSRVGLDRGRYRGHSFMSPFLTWIAKERGISNKQPFGWTELRESYNSDAEAFEALPLLYAAYVEATGEGRP